MKKILMVLFLISVLLVLCSYSCDSARSTIEEQQKQMAIDSLTAVPIPIVKYFQEKKTIAEWAKRWDTPTIPTYVYLISYGKILGYYVCNGKPASTRSYIMPEESYYYEGAVLSNPDIDGTYGDNNPGIRFFTAEGVAVEWAGDGASYIYSDAPLPLEVPRFNVSKK
jgi:hypothetical protein